ncbi:MAG: Anti-sigma regulatory factor (Ser/Thr protein kinase) [Acidobacteria bacterium]|nr:Anti-sigma regulatory factor (Ser/Thr protein kinase) [Acidobacteriota bacterium]
MIKSTDRIEIRIGSALEYLDLVQTLTDCITDFMGFDEDTAHWIGMSVRESVTNAIQHGNKLDQSKRVDIRFEVAPDQLDISVRDQGTGFQVERLPNPLDAENLLKPSGRGIFYIRSFMDEVEFIPHVEGGMEVHMVKKVSSNQAVKETEI